jgi:putative toxin-antitoxin system antitoxin component (TIGR02293 family)
MTSAARIVAALGGRGVLRERPRGYDSVIDRARAGLPYASLEAVARRFEIPQEALVRVLNLPLRTLARRKKERRLHANESDRLLRLGRIAALAEEVLGGRERAAAWLRKPNRALGGASPLDRLDTDLGAKEVEQVIFRIAHGVYS